MAPDQSRLCIRGSRSDSDLRSISFAESFMADNKISSASADEVCFVISTKTRNRLNASSNDQNDEDKCVYSSERREVQVKTENDAISAGFSELDNTRSTARFPRETKADSGFILHSIRERLADLSSPGLRDWKFYPDGRLDYEDKPIIRILVPHVTSRSKSLTPQQIVREVLEKPLTPQEIGMTSRQTTHEGLIYIYRFTGEYNVVKIGVTQQRSVEDRLMGWNKKCNHKTHLVYPCKLEVQLVPHVYRVEALVHAELAASNLVEIGCSCGRQHREWFEEELAHARKVVIKWSQWMRKHPYQENSPQQWNLKEEHMNDLESLSSLSSRDKSGSIDNQRQQKSSPNPKLSKNERRTDQTRTVTAPALKI